MEIDSMEIDATEMQIDQEKELPIGFNWRYCLKNGRVIVPDVTKQIGETCFAHAITKAVEARLRLMLAVDNIPHTFDRELNFTHKRPEADLSIRKVIDDLYTEMEIEQFGMELDKVMRWVNHADFTTTYIYPNRKDRTLSTAIRLSRLDYVKSIKKDGDLNEIESIKKEEDLNKILDELFKFGPFVAVIDVAFEDWDRNGKTTFRAKKKLKRKKDTKENAAVTHHAILITGYDKKIDGGCFFYQNHSGNEFGEGGYGRIAFDVPLYFLVPRVVIQNR